MFGMFDYRAHKLYLLLFGLPIFIFSLITVFGLPLLSYGLGIHLSDTRIWQILISIALQIFNEIVWTFFLTVIINKLCNFLFSIFVDVIPCDNRTKEEAQLVVYSGSKAITLIDIDRIHPSQWSDELIASVPKTDWVRNIFYRQITMKRFEMLREYFTQNPSEAFTIYNVEKIVKNSPFPFDFVEKTLTNVRYRRMLIIYTFFIYLLLFKPF